MTTGSGDRLLRITYEYATAALAWGSLAFLAATTIHFTSRFWNWLIP